MQINIHSFIASVSVSRSFGFRSAFGSSIQFDDSIQFDGSIESIQFEYLATLRWLALERAIVTWPDVRIEKKWLVKVNCIVDLNCFVE